MSVVFGWLPQPIGGMAVLQQGFVESLFNFCTYDGGPQGRKEFGGYTYAATGYIPSGRNTLASTFLEKTDGEWLLSLDWDITYDPLAVYQLLDAADPVERPIISGVYVTYFGEGAALRPCWMAEQDGQEYIPVSSFEAGKIVPLTVCGMGFTLIHRSVFERIAADPRYADDPWQWYGHDIIGADRTGEDLTFCARARSVGATVWGHGGVLLGHTKAKMLTPLDMGDGAFGAQTSQALDAPVLEQRVHRQERVLNVGGGSKDIPLPARYDGWDHVLLDIKAGPDVDIVLDARDLGWELDFGLAEAVFDSVYCSHNIEHHYAHEIPIVLAGFARVLRPGGEVLVRCPDVAAVCAAVSSGAPLDGTLYESPAGPITPRDVFYGYGREIEESGEPFYAHKTGFTAETLAAALVAAGFVNVSVARHESAFELEATGTKALVSPGA